MTRLVSTQRARQMVGFRRPACGNDAMKLVCRSHPNAPPATASGNQPSHRSFPRESTRATWPERRRVSGGVHGNQEWMTMRATSANSQGQAQVIRTARRSCVCRFQSLQNARASQPKIESVCSPHPSRSSEIELSKVIVAVEWSTQTGPFADCWPIQERTMSRNIRMEFDQFMKRTIIRPGYTEEAERSLAEAKQEGGSDPKK